MGRSEGAVNRLVHLITLMLEKQYLNLSFFSLNNSSDYSQPFLNIDVLASLWLPPHSIRTQLCCILRVPIAPSAYSIIGCLLPYFAIGT